MTTIKIPHTAAYTGPRDALAHRTPGGGIQIDGVGYYEESIALTAEHLRQLDFIRRPAVDDRARHDPWSEYDASHEGEPMSHPFDQHYFHGGSKVGGYAGDGYRDYPAHMITAQKILDLAPESVLELGCARGYVLKRIEDHGIPVLGLEISEHCRLTRVLDPVRTCDITITPWPVAGRQFDLCVSVAVLEHIPEDELPAVFAEMARTCRRGLHGIDVHDEDGFDKTHVTIRPIEWWRERMPPGHEAVDKEELERGSVLPLLPSPTPLRLNLGSFTTMFYGWENVDVLDLSMWARQRGYLFTRADLRHRLPYDDESAALIYMSHVLEHLNYEQGVELLAECRRVLHRDGTIRILVPNLAYLANMYLKDKMGQFDELNAYAHTQGNARKFWEFVAYGHQSAYDAEALHHACRAAGFHRVQTMSFRESLLGRMKRETIDMYPGLSLIVEAQP